MTAEFVGGNHLSYNLLGLAHAAQVALRLLPPVADFPVIEKTVFRLMIGMGLPIISAVLMEQLPKSGIADIPFAFRVRDQILPPGTYTVKQADRGRGICIQNEKTPGLGTKCVAARREFGRAQEARLIFERKGVQYSLAEIWFDPEGRGSVLQEPHVDNRDLRTIVLH